MIYDNVSYHCYDEESSQFLPKAVNCQLELQFLNNKFMFTCLSANVQNAPQVLFQLESCVKNLEWGRLGKKGITMVYEGQSSLFVFPSENDLTTFQRKVRQFEREAADSVNVFDRRTEDSSSVQYFQFYSFLSQQQNMLQDYVRTATYQRAALANASDFQDKVVLDVGAGSGILSFFAVQAGARKVYAVEASNMSTHCEDLVKSNNLQDKIQVITGKIEEINIPEKVDTIISEPMGYMLFNERMLETFLHAKKFLRPGGKMFPSVAHLYCAPFTDEALFGEQVTKANFWWQQYFYGVNLSCLRDASLAEYLRQPVVDTWDMSVLVAAPQRHTVDFRSAEESELHVIDFPLQFTVTQSGLIHGLAFWFDVGFLGSAADVWLSTSPTEPLTHWYQVRCLFTCPLFATAGHTVKGRLLMTANERQSYDLDIELGLPNQPKCSNRLDLKNPCFRYTGGLVCPLPGTNNKPPSETAFQGLLEPAAPAASPHFNMQAPTSSMSLSSTNTGPITVTTSTHPPVSLM